MNEHISELITTNCVASTKIHKKKNTKNAFSEKNMWCFYWISEYPLTFWSYWLYLCTHAHYLWVADKDTHSSQNLSSLLIQVNYKIMLRLTLCYSYEGLSVFIFMGLFTSSYIINQWIQCNAILLWLLVLFISIK